MCLSRTRGDQPLDTMGHSGARKHDRMCSVEHDASPGEKRRGTMVYMLTTPTCTSSIAQLRVRVCGVGSRRERVRAAPGLVRVRIRVRVRVRVRVRHLTCPQPAPAPRSARGCLGLLHVPA